MWNGYAYVDNNPLAYTDPSGLGIFGDIGSIIGSMIPGVGTLLGWGIGSIADVLTGQSVSAPGLAGIESDIIGSIAGSVNNGQIWNEQWLIGGGGTLNTGSVFGSGNTGPFIFSFGDGNSGAGGFWTRDYSGAPYWYVPTSHTTSTGAQLRAGSKPSSFSVAGSCVVASFKDHMLGIGAATASGYLPKPLLGVRGIGSSNTTLLSKLGSYINIQTARAYGPGARSTTNLFRGLGRALGPAALIVNAGELLRTGQDAASCYSSSH